MNRIKITMTLAIAAVLLMVSVPAFGQHQVNYLNNQSQQLEFPLFSNYYTPQGPSMTTAAMYNAPHPVPYWVGGSMYTYQPYYPHQHLYQHAKNYYNYYGTADQFYSDNQRGGRGGAALNKTTVVWKGGGYWFGNLPLSSYPAQKLRYGIHARKYGLYGCPDRLGRNRGGCVGGCQ